MDGLLLDPIDDQHPLCIVFHVAVHLRPELDSEVVGRLFHVRSRQPEYRDAFRDPQHDRFGDFVVSAHHPVEHTMRLHMMERYAFTVQETFQSPNLVDGDSGELFGLELHLSTTEALEVWEAGVGADLDVVFLAEADGVLHDKGVTGVEAAGDVRVGD